MARALALAERGLFTAHPNPRVGCVIAAAGEVIGEGWHARTGEPHAEVHALRQAGERARGATAYVTLEPCAHHGRTPPCVDALIEAGVARVVVACGDPFEHVNGAGHARLRAAGIEVNTGVLEDEARDLNRGFLSRVQRGRPWVRLKLATSLDARTGLADGRSQWITGEASRADVQRWRARSSAILTGIGTVLGDDPHLTVRLPADEPFLPALRVVLDGALKTPAGARVLDEAAPTLLIGDEAIVRDRRLGDFDGIVGVARQGRHLDLHAVLAVLAQRQVNEVQIEAGPRLSGAFVDAGLVDEILLYVNPSLLGDASLPMLRLPAPTDLDARLRWRFHDVQPVGEDLRLLLRQPARCAG
ncbi:MAG TPA: bifunctional diaminohydroxyphosphoribosylaminopyrimidine deaminase/5-amino-6-(5-phosphoribosylamino)uracil reductase RibD [Xanthomonadaceae bacterium]|nr:bifunctional diaminohydroxyphosphoribosylaminopyrimidine deaminase/5-amino-6-(5-phosphoribosylamino)uracil reductase RibD [Xanthomonadaceae bacterium]